MEPNPSEYTLALRAQSGDREAVAELVERTRMRLFALAYAELRHYEDAHDAVASALLHVCLHIRTLREPERVLPWMQSIVRNEVRQLRRSRGIALLRLEETDAPTDATENSLLRLDIERALRRLPGSQAHALRLFYLGELSVREIAQQTGGSEGAVKMWLHRGRKHLASEMRGYMPMTTTQTPPQETIVTRTAAILHSDLEPALVQSLQQALQTGGYAAEVVTPSDLGDLNKRAIHLIEKARTYHLLVLDEQIGGRSPFEYLLNLKAHGETKDIPVCLLYSVNPDAFAGTAFFGAGVDRLLNKTDPAQMAHFANPFRSWRDNCWSLFTEKARHVVRFAQEEALRWGENTVSTEHLLLGLVRDAPPSEPPNVAVRILTGPFGISVENIRAETKSQLQIGPGRDEQQEMQLTPRSKRVIDLAYDEARLLGNDYIGTEHLLLGMVREEEGRAGRVLIHLGVDLEKARLEVRALQQNSKTA